MTDDRLENPEEVIADYVERYGLTEKARQYFQNRPMEESYDPYTEPERPKPN